MDDEQRTLSAANNNRTRSLHLQQDAMRMKSFAWMGKRSLIGILDLLDTVRYRVSRASVFR